MLIRSIALSIALLIGLGTIIPIATEYAEAGAKKRKVYKQKKRQWTGVKPYSKRWWQLYRAQERRKKQRAQQARALRLRQARLAKAREAAEVSEQQEVASAEPVQQTQPQSAKVILPSGNPAPENWRQAGTSNGELQFEVKNGNSKVGSASVAVVGPATGETNTVGRNRTLGGVPTTSLRREVINQMVQENGWVVNDYQKEVGGKQVYVVVAQSQTRSGSVQSRMFYFTESEGRIYSVATNASNDSAETIAMESEKMIHSLHGTTRQMQQAAVKGIIRERIVAEQPVQQQQAQQPTQMMPCAPYVPPQQ